MSGILNLESALRTCKVDVGYQQRIQSDRFLNPKNLVCPVWNGLDAAGRVVCADSFYTKREGCNSAQDRVGVENIQRPQYMQYISDFVSGNNYNYNSGVPAVAGSKIAVEGFTPTAQIRKDELEKIKEKTAKEANAIKMINDAKANREKALKDAAAAKEKAARDEAAAKAKEAKERADKEKAAKAAKEAAKKTKTKDGFQFLPKNSCGC